MERNWLEKKTRRRRNMEKKAFNLEKPQEKHRFLFESVLIKVLTNINIIFILFAFLLQKPLTQCDVSHLTQILMQYLMHDYVNR